MLDKIARLTRLDRARLTKVSLVKTAMIILFIYGLLAVGQSWTGFGLNTRELALRAYENEGFNAGEKILVERLRQDPKMREAWILLVRKRAELSLHEKDGNEQAEPTPKVTGLKPDAITLENTIKRLARSSNREPYLSDEEFENFLKTARSPSPAVLELIYKSHTEGLIRALEFVDQERASTEILLTIGDLYREDGLLEEALKSYKKVLGKDPNLVSTGMRIVIKNISTTVIETNFFWQLSRLLNPSGLFILRTLYSSLI